MKNLLREIILFCIALAVKIPFLPVGYGVEEDSWGHVLNAALMHKTGVYEISRLPGHPLFEALLYVLWNVHSPLIYNAISAVASAGSVVIFYRILKSFQLKNALGWSLAFAAIPVVFISGTYTIDYGISLFFCLAALLAAKRKNQYEAGVWVAIAAGFRITSLGMLLPLSLLLIYEKGKENSMALRARRAAKMSVISVILGSIFYLLPFAKYGWSFFDFHKPPYPPFLEIIYKMSIGVWGVLGIIGIGIGLLVLLLHRKKAKAKHPFIILLFSAVLLWGAAYFRMPEKAAFWLPVVPFLILWFAHSLPQKTSIAVISLFVLSSAFFGINKANPHTGASHSAFAKIFGSTDGKLFFDPINGPALNDLSKRKNKEKAVENIIQSLEKIEKPTLLVAGWWYAMLEVKKTENIWKNPNVELRYYADQKELIKWQQKGYQLRYLPEQAEINDRKYNTDFTVKNALILPIE